MKKILIIASLLFVLFFSSCDEQGGPQEGELVYQISYLQSESDNPLITLLPKTIVIRFKDNNTVAYIEGFFGTFQLRFINNSDQQESYTVLRILDKKYISINNIDSLSAGYENLTGVQITINESDTASIAGLLCYEVDVVCHKLSDSIVKFYYTNDIDIDHPNSNTPFNEIDGLLTKFQTKVAGIDMVFELIEFKNILINENEFLAPPDYEEITSQELNDILQSFQE